jgi:hypothetical protein
MIEQWAAALEATHVAAALRNSVWCYPLVNTAHILGVALLVGSILPLDLRILGVWNSVPLAPLSLVLARVAAVGLVLAIVFGALLFITRATEYTASNLFITKMLAVATGILNALAMRIPFETPTNDRRPPVRLRLAAGLSLCIWLTALTLGRLVGYF